MRAEMGGLTFKAEVYTHESSINIAATNPTVCLDAEGEKDAVFIFNANSTLTTCANSEIVLLNDARKEVLGTALTMGADSTLVGNVLEETFIVTATSNELVGGGGENTLRISSAQWSYTGFSPVDGPVYVIICYLVPKISTAYIFNYLAINTPYTFYARLSLVDDHGARSFRRGATTRATNAGVKEDDIDWLCRWNDTARWFADVLRSTYSHFVRQGHGALARRWHRHSGRLPSRSFLTSRSDDPRNQCWRQGGRH
jgi:hypothetical protein